MSIVADIERTLAKLRQQEAADGTPELRTSTMTHVVWAPPEWLDRARATLAALDERHPARTIFLVPQPGRRDALRATATLRDFQVSGLSREILSEVIEIRLCGQPARHPASIVLPLLISDLPAFCRWRGMPPWGSSALEEIVELCDRLVVDSSEWRGLPGAYGELAARFDEIAVSDIAYRRALPWRIRLADLWPGIAGVERLSVDGPRADALLLAGWLRSRLGRDVRLARRSAETIGAVRVDGEAVTPPAVDPPSPGDLLSQELDVVARDPVYEAAVRAA